MDRLQWTIIASASDALLASDARPDARDEVREAVIHEFRPPEGGSTMRRLKASDHRFCSTTTSARDHARAPGGPDLHSERRTSCCLMSNATAVHLCEERSAYSRPKSQAREQLSAGEWIRGTAGVRELQHARVARHHHPRLKFVRGRAASGLQGDQAGRCSPVSIRSRRAKYEAAARCAGEAEAQHASLHYEPENLPGPRFGFRCGFLACSTWTSCRSA